MSDTTETTLPFETVRVPNGDKPKGFEEVISDGVEGKKVTVKNDDGQIVSERVTPAKNEVIYFGTKEDGEDEDSISSGSAGDETISNTTETVSTPESPQEETEKDTPKKNETDKDSSDTLKTDDSNQSQGGFLQTSPLKGDSMKTSALKKAALEAARLLVFAIPGILITVFTDNPELGGSLGATILLVLKSLDRGIHEDKTNDVKGLLPF